MAGEVEIAWIELGALATGMAEHGTAQVVDHHLFGDAQDVEGVDVRCQELLHGLREREFDVHLPAPGQHHDEERQATARVADGKGSELPPVDLSNLA